MLYQAERHEPLDAIPWVAAQAQAWIRHIVADTEAHAEPAHDWPLHPRDVEPGDDPTKAKPALYHGTAGVIWALHHLQDLGAARLARSHLGGLDDLLARNRAWLGDQAHAERAAYLMGDLPIELLAFGEHPTPERALRLAELIRGNLDHPARELMWGSPGTLLAAAFLHERTGDDRWAGLFRMTAERLWAQLIWSDEHQCHHWTQDLYGRNYSFLDGVHGFVATASVLIRGRHLLSDATWGAWQACIVNTVTRTAQHEAGQVNWRPMLIDPPGKTQPLLMQFCHGAPGFVICLGDLPGQQLDPLLCAAGEAIWAAGPLKKGANLCHGTGGNGYAFLKLYRRTGDPLWLGRARAFAMHAIQQSARDEAAYGQLQYSLWTGDLGLACYLWNCMRGEALFPTLDCFYPALPGSSHSRP
ncbi:MAG: LanC-like protein [Vitreoscilla sp.]|nr:LanC-like protein [Vitreoscilla sp.]